MASYQTRTAIMGCGDYLSRNIKMQNGTGEKSVDSSGRRGILALDSKLGRKQPHRMCSCSEQEEGSMLQLCLLTSCSNRKARCLPLHNQ